MKTVHGAHTLANWMFFESSLQKPLLLSNDACLWDWRQVCTIWKECTVPSAVLDFSQIAKKELDVSSVLCLKVPLAKIKRGLQSRFIACHWIYSPPTTLTALSTFARVTAQRFYRSTSGEDDTVHTLAQHLPAIEFYRTSHRNNKKRYGSTLSVKEYFTHCLSLTNLIWKPQ